MMLIIGLTTHGEADEVGTKTEAGTLTSSNTNAGRDEVEEDEYAGSSNTKGEDFTHVEFLLGDEHSSESNGKTLDEVLDYTRDKVR